MLTGIANAGVYFVLLSLVAFLMLAVDHLLVRAYRLWPEIARGNTAVGLAAAGKMIGLGIIAMLAIQHNEGVWQSVVWTLVGGIFQVAGYFLFELVTPRLAVGRELAAGNRAVGVLVAGMSIGLSLIIGGCIS